MKRIFITLIAAIAAFTAVQAQEMDQAGMKAWQEYMKVSDVHKMLAKSNGTWKTETTMWMDPKGAPTKATGTCVNKMILGGRYQESTFKSKMMGMPFEGKSTLGYDNAKKMFYNTWVDNMGTGMMMLSGKWDDASKSITFNGTVVDPMTGQDMPVREIFTIIDDNHHKMEMFMTYNGQEMKNMEVAFTRTGK